jgi:hypothetical protein
MKTERINTPLDTIYMYKKTLNYYKSIEERIYNVCLIYPEYLTRFGEEEFSRNHVIEVKIEEYMKT